METLWYRIGLEGIPHPEHEGLRPWRLLIAQEVPQQAQLRLLEHGTLHRHGLTYADQPARCPPA